MGSGSWAHALGGSLEPSVRQERVGARRMGCHVHSPTLFRPEAFPGPHVSGTGSDVNTPIFCGDPNSRNPAGSARAPCPHGLRCGSCWQHTGTGIIGSGSGTRSPQLTTMLGPAHRGALPEAPLGISGLQKLLMEADQGRAAEQRPSRPQAVAASRAWGPMAA